MSEPWPILKKPKLDEEPDAEESKKPRIKKKMYALLMAYCGQGYLGLQRNVGSKTIEEELMQALKKIDVVNEEEFRKQQLINFQRAARTDKGVSAIRQVLSLSMREGVTPEEINQHLPAQIRVLAVKRVTKGFNSKNTCNARTYSYTCPSFAFAPKSVTRSEEYRIDDEAFANLNKYSECFLGTHNFHNFTSGRKPFDPSCKRHILQVEWKKPILSHDLELVTFLVKGQSFMLHQIRKMIGTLMAVTRGHVPPDYITQVFDPNESAHLPTAPGLGLLLEQVHYDWYNKKYGGNGFHEKLDFADVEHLVQEFREKEIYPILIKTEKEEKSMLTYLDTLDIHYEEYHNIEKALNLEVEKNETDDVESEQNSEMPAEAVENMSKSSDEILNSDEKSNSVTS